MTMATHIFTNFDAPQLIAPNPGFNASLGGTASSVVLGVNPYKGRRELYLELTGAVAPVGDNPAMARGRTFEPVILQAYQASHPELEMTDLNPVTGERWFVQHSHLPYITGQPDAIALDPVSGASEYVIEIKTASVNTLGNWGEGGSDKVPEQYLCQVQQYMALMGIPKCVLIVWFFRDSENGEAPCAIREYSIDFDPELWAIIEREEKAFWENHVEKMIPPEIDSVGSVYEAYIREHYPINTMPAETATPDEIDALSSYIAAKERVEEAENALAVCKVRLQELIGERDGIKSSIGSVSWKCSKDSQTIDYKSAIAEAGIAIPAEILERNTKIRHGARVFRVTPKK